MDELLFMEKFLGSLLEEEKIFKLHSAILYKEDTLKITFILNALDYDKYLDDSLKEKVSKIIREIIPSDIRIEISYKKTITEDKYINKAILDYIYKEIPTAFTSFKNYKINIEIAGNYIKIILSIEKYMYKFCNNLHLKEKLEAYLESIFMEDIEVNLSEIPNSSSSGEDIIIERNTHQDGEWSIRTVDIKIKDPLLGTIGKMPRYILDVKDNESENVTICGAVSGYKEKTMKSREGKFYLFNINDTTANIPVKFFPRNDRAQKCAEKLKDGDIIVLEGNIKFDQYSNKNSILINKLASCDIVYESINLKPKYKEENEVYTRIFPQAYVNEVQQELFNEKVKEDNAVLMGKTFVVFDLETTGIELKNDKITEIAAIKIVDGKMTECFHTLVNPGKEVSEFITNLTGITNDMLVLAPSFEEIAADFYKFTRNSILVAHNAPFDVGFITQQGRDCLYDFDNSSVDTLILAKQRLKLSHYKLESVCKELGVSLEGAHRAFNDTLSTANVFIKLMQKK